MSKITLTKETAPGIPPVGKVHVFIDNTDGKAKKIDENGNIFDLEQNVNDLGIWRGETTGSGNAYGATVAGWGTPSNILNTLILKFHADSTTTPNPTPTLSVNFGAPRDIVRYDGSNIPAGFLKTGAVYILSYDTATLRFIVANDGPTLAGEANTASNIGYGEGSVFKQKTVANLEMRTIYGNGDMAVSTDTPNDVVVVSKNFFKGAPFNPIAATVYFENHALNITQADVENGRYTVGVTYKNASNKGIRANTFSGTLELAENVWSAGNPSAANQIHREANTVRLYSSIAATNAIIFIMKNR